MINKLKVFLYVLLISFACNQSFSQNINTTYIKDTTCCKKNIGNIILDDFKVSFNDGIRTFSTPFHFKTKDVIITASVLSTTALLFTVDDELRTYFHKQNSSFNDNLKNVGNYYGSVYTSLLAGSGFYTAGLFSGNEYIRTTGRMVFESFVISGLITLTIKSVLGRHRPYTEDGSTKFEGPTFNSDYFSLPSGHATAAFALSTTLANRFHNIYASIGLYTLAGISSFARIYDDEHWASDVFLGSAIGYFVADFISGKKNNDCAYQIYPTINGLKLVYNF